MVDVILAIEVPDSLKETVINELREPLGDEVAYQEITVAELVMGDQIRWIVYQPFSPRADLGDFSYNLLFAFLAKRNDGEIRAVVIGQAAWNKMYEDNFELLGVLDRRYRLLLIADPDGELVRLVERSDF